MMMCSLYKKDPRPQRMIKIGDMEVKTLFDSGASTSVLDWRMFLKLKDRPKLNSANFKVKDASVRYMEIQGIANLPVQMVQLRLWEHLWL